MLLCGLCQVLLRFGYNSNNHSCRTWTDVIRLGLEIGSGAAECLHENAASICCKFPLQVGVPGQVWVTKNLILLFQKYICDRSYLFSTCLYGKGIEFPLKDRDL